MFLEFAATATTKAAATSSRGGVSFYIIIVLFAALYFLYLRPRRQKLMARQQALRETQSPTDPVAGDTVVTTSGIIGRVLSIDGDRASVEIAPDTVVEIHRTSLGRRLDPLVPPDEGDRWASLVPPEGEDAPAENPAHGEPGHVHDGDDDEEHPGGAQ